MENYLIENNFDKKLKKINNKLKNKTVVIYGTGKLFQAIIKNYNLSNLNIIGITDRKYQNMHNINDKEYGYKIIPYNEFSQIKADYILIAVKEYKPIQTQLRQLCPKSKIISVLEDSIIKTFTDNIRKRKTNIILLVKQSGKKVMNPKIKNLKVNFIGQNNVIEIHEPYQIENHVNITLNSNNKIIIEHSNRHNICNIIMNDDNMLHIGSYTTISNVEIRQPAVQTYISIGSDCMLSYNIEIRNSDGHSIYDKNTHKLLNPPANINIGVHVWISKGTTILKGSSIPSNSIIGASSLINKKFVKENCIIAGIPAEIVKENVNWDRQPPNNFL